MAGKGFAQTKDTKEKPLNVGFRRFKKYSNPFLKTPSGNHISYLQRSLGNNSMNRMFESGMLQETHRAPKTDNKDTGIVQRSVATEGKDGTKKEPISVKRTVQQGTIIQRDEDEEEESELSLPPILGEGVDLYKSVTPFMARALGSVTIDGFELGKAEISSTNEKKLQETATHIIKLFQKYPGSTVQIIGHTDAIDTPEYNKVLGQSRADATSAALQRMGVPADAIKTGSLGESELLINTKRAEPRNRRVQVIFIPYTSSIKMNWPELKLTPPVMPGISPGERGKPRLFPPDIGTPGQPDISFNVPQMPPEKRRNWLEEGLKKDPIVRKLPKWMRDKVVDGLKDGDEMVAEKVIDSLPLDSKVKAAVKAVAKTLLQLLKGRQYKPPPQPHPQYTLPPSEERKFPKMPGEVIIPGPVIRF